MVEDISNPEIEDNFDDEYTSKDIAREKLLENEDIYDMKEQFDNTVMRDDVKAEDFGESVHPLTQRNYIDFDQDVFNPAGFDADENKQGAEKQRNILEADKDKEVEEVDERARREWLIKFRKEVDFHHKVAYRYEKVYRLGKK